MTTTPPRMIAPPSGVLYAVRWTGADGIRNTKLVRRRDAAERALLEVAAAGLSPVGLYVTHLDAWAPVTDEATPE